MKHIMSYSLREKGKYYHALIKYKENGKWKQKSMSTGIEIGSSKRRKEAEEIAQKYRNQLELNICNKQIIKDYLFTDIVEEWYTQKELRVSTNTCRFYRDVLDYHILPYFKTLKRNIEEIYSRDIEKFLDYELKKVSANSVRKYYMTLNNIFSYAQRNEYITKNPCDNVEPPKKQPKKEIIPYNSEEIKKLLKISKGSSIEVPIYLTIFYGLRREEVLGLRYSAIDFDQKILRINHTAIMNGGKTVYQNSTKNKTSNRVLPLLPQVEEYLLKLKEHQAEMKNLCGSSYSDSDYVCRFDDGTLISPTYVSHTFKSLLAKNGLRPIRFHDLRHSVATNLLRAGATAKHVQVWLGHSNISTTLDLYTNFNFSDKEEIGQQISELYL